MTADHLLALAHQAGDPHAADQLVRRCEDICSAIASDFFHPSLEHDDFLQAARIGAFKACRDFRADGGSSFRVFAGLCVRREVVTLLKTAQRGKHRPLTDSVREVAGEDGEPVQLIDWLPAYGSDPADVVETRGHLVRLVRATRRLTDIERRWLTFHMNGGDYSARIDGRRNKQAENAVDRARRKLMEAA